jgi:hypothetical protein
MILLKSFPAMIFTFFVFQSHAQVEAFVFGESSIPIGEFRENTSAEGWGFGGGINFPLGTPQVRLGTELAYNIYGKNFFEDPMNELEVISNNNLFSMHGVLRIEAKTKSDFNPYIDLLGGFRYFYTRTKIKEDVFSEPLETSTDFKDVAHSYGFGLGFYYLLGGDGGLDLRFSVFRGGEAEFLDSRSVHDDGAGNLVFDPKTSTTDIFNVRLGFIGLL